MNSENRTEWQFSIIKAYHEGKAIEVKGRDIESEFRVLPKNQYFNFSELVYRIKPETGKDRLLDDLRDIIAPLVTEDEDFKCIIELASRIRAGDYNDFT